MIAPVMPTYARAPVAFDRGEGSWLIATDGTRYLDFGAGIAVCSLGHAHPKLVAALEAQARRLWHTSNLFPIPNQEALAAKLVEHTFADTVFFTNSGVEAMECALKMARKHFTAKGEPERHRVITFAGSFHGRSLATISAAGSAKLTDGFGPLLPGFDHLPWADHDAVRAAVTGETAAILIEPVQGEGGIRPVPEQCLKGLRDLCDEHGILLIFDEIQSGMGRTGRLFAHEWSGIEPDIMAVAKGIGGGFPLGACLATERAAAGMTTGTHGSTYGGNPLACAVGAAVMDEMTAPGFLEGVRAKAGYLAQRLGELAGENEDLIEGIRGEGLMRGIRLREGRTPADFVAACREAHLIAIPAADNTVRILPPLTTSEEELAEGVARLGKACAGLRGP